MPGRSKRSKKTSPVKRSEQSESNAPAAQSGPILPPLPYKPTYTFHLAIYHHILDFLSQHNPKSRTEVVNAACSRHYKQLYLAQVEVQRLLSLLRLPIPPSFRSIENPRNFLPFSIVAHISEGIRCELDESSVYFKGNIKDFYVERKK